MPAGHVRQPVLERNRSLREKEKASKHPLSKHLLKVYPIGFHKTSSAVSLPSLSLSISSNESSFSGYWDRKQFEAAVSRPEVLAPVERKGNANVEVMQVGSDGEEGEEGDLKRCHWITKSSDQVYVSFHDERWGVPIYEDSELFELLTLSGMLMDQNWTEILSKRDLYREALAKFDPNTVAKMEEKEIAEISSNRKLMLPDYRLRCIVENAKCILKVAKECGSFSNYIWGLLSFKPIVNRFRYPRSVPLRTPKAEAISKELLRRGFRLVGPVITYTFMQAAGMTIDHLVDCFRYNECVSLVEMQWEMTDMIM